MSFYDELINFNWDEVQASIYNKKEIDVIKALENVNPNLEDFKALISPAAKPFLEIMAKRSKELTLKRFGKIIQLYIPLYLSNSCTNHCVYCGFNHNNNIERKTLSKTEVDAEIKIIKDLGYEHILLVTGEDNKNSNSDYLNEMVKYIKPNFSLISIEVQPLETEEYQKLAISGVNTVYVYQETYNKLKYKDYHPKGKKSDFKYRLETPDRIGEASIHRIGLGCLLGLEDWRTDSFFTALHYKYLEKKYWKTKYSISFPRLRPNAGSFNPKNPVNSKELFQLICAYRILSETIELSISTRESRSFRDNIIGAGITSISAGSKTNPGGYSASEETLEQFEVNDDRSPLEISEMIKSKGYETVWKDWDSYMQIFD